jgi:hypothetical protein
MPREMSQIGKRRKITDTFFEDRRDVKKPILRQTSRLSVKDLLEMNVKKEFVEAIAKIRARAIHGATISELLLEYSPQQLFDAGLDRKKVVNAYLPLARQRNIELLRNKITSESSKISKLLLDYTPWELVQAGFNRSLVRQEYMKILKSRGSLVDIVRTLGFNKALDLGYSYKAVSAAAAKLKKQA